MSPLERGICVFVGGGIGATTRYWLGLWITGRTGPSFPWNTLAINVTGSFLIGIILGLLGNSPSVQGWRLFLVIGILGGYTTFSSFAWESLNLLRERSYAYATGYFLGTCAVGLIVCWLGLLVAHTLTKN